MLYFPDEKVRVIIAVDNRQSQRRIQNINCYLRQTVKVVKDKTDESAGNFWTETYELHRIQINKGNFSQMHQKKSASLKNSKGSADDNMRVHGKFVLDFDLEEILKNINELRNAKNEKQISQILQKTSMQKVQMTKYHQCTDKNHNHLMHNESEQKIGTEVSIKSNNFGENHN